MWKLIFMKEYRSKKINHMWKVIFMKEYTYVPYILSHTHIHII